jgi:DNA-binding PadR family transcriptional regulator
VPNADPPSHAPPKPLVFQILVALSVEDRHGWDLVREIQADLGGERLLPANFYRTLRGMLADGLIEESGRRRGDDDERRRYFRLTALGRDIARREARRLHALMADARTRRLLGPAPGGVRKS